MKIRLHPDKDLKGSKKNTLIILHDHAQAFENKAMRNHYIGNCF